MRNGFPALQAQAILHRDPFSGHLLVSAVVAAIC
jgi:hypothetical protein